MFVKVKGFLLIPLNIKSLPASILFAIAISPSLERSSTFPISLRYILTGSSVLPNSLSEALVDFTTSPLVVSLPTTSVSESFDSSSVSTKLIPTSEIMA